MVSLLIVSHSATLANGVKEVLDQVTGAVLHVEAVGGTADGALGTSADLIQGALQKVMSPDGTLILVDIGSTTMSVEIALEACSGSGIHAVISDAPLVEGAYLAAAEAAAGADLEQTAAAALRAHDLKKVHE